MKTFMAMVTLVVAGYAAGAVAQTLADPTRPPGSLADGGTAVLSGPVLQSVMLSPGRKVAVISGEMVALGGRYGESRLVRLTENEAVLKNGGETTVLRLYPLVDKRSSTRPVPGEAKTRAGRTTK